MTDVYHVIHFSYRLATLLIIFATSICVVSFSICNLCSLSHGDMLALFVISCNIYCHFASCILHENSFKEKRNRLSICILTFVHYSMDVNVRRINTVAYIDLLIVKFNGNTTKAFLLFEFYSILIFIQNVYNKFEKY